MKTIAALLALFAFLGPAHSEMMEVRPVAENVYAIVGPLTNRTPENLGNNATFGVVVTSEGVVLIDSGGTAKGAAAIESAIRQVTDQPVKVVINTGGQDHRWLGNAYFKARGARIIASRRAVEDQRARTQDQFFILGTLVGEAGLAGTEAVHADEVFDERLDLTVGDTRFELHHAAHAHTPGDAFVWLPAQRVVFSGDIVYMERMLGVTAYSRSRTWIEAFDAMAALDPKVVVPGHGTPAPLARAVAETRDYLVFLREAVGEFMDNGGGIEAIGSIDQSHFSQLFNFEQLKGRNAQQVYQEMEWE